MPARVTKNTPLEVTLATTLLRIIPGDDVHVIWFRCGSDAYLVYDDAKNDGDAVGATARFFLAAGTYWPIEINGVRPLIAAIAGTPTASLLGSYGVPS